MPAIKEGDRVRVQTREQTSDDIKTGTYYPHFAGLTGEVRKVYTKDEVSIEIEPESLTREVRKRHEDIRDQMKTKWLDGLSEEGRSKLTEREKDFNLRYMLLVGVADLEQVGAAQKAPKPVEQPRAAEPPRRKTLAEIEAAEEEELSRHRSSSE